MRGVVAPGSLELDHDLPGRVGLHAPVGQSGACDAAAQLLQRLAVVGATAHSCVQAEAVDVGAQRLLEVRVPGHALQAAPALASAGPSRGTLSTLHRQHLLAGAPSAPVVLVAPSEQVVEIGHLDGWGGGLYGGPSIFSPWTRGNGHERFVTVVAEGTGSLQLCVGSCRVGFTTVSVTLS